MQHRSSSQCESAFLASGRVLVWVCARRSQCTHSQQKWNLGLVFFLEKRFGRRPYCCTLLASGHRSLPLVTLTGTWTHRGQRLLYHNVQSAPENQIIIVVIIILLFLMISCCRRIPVATNMLSVDECIWGIPCQQLVMIGPTDSTQADLFFPSLCPSSAARLLFSALVAHTHIHTSVVCFHAVRHFLKREIWAYCTQPLKIFSNLINRFQTTDMK